MRGRVLVVAGSDSGGGAGIQADIKTVMALGGYATTAIAALTAQNTLGVHEVMAVPAAFVRRQMEVVLDDIGADCVKTGMLRDAAVIETVAAVLAAKVPDAPLVLDPVMAAKGGAELLRQQALTALTERLIPRATVLTPNLPEAEVLTGLAIDGVPAMRQAAAALRRLGARHVLIKGGHLPGDMVRDLFLAADGAVEILESPRIETRHSHGTGCTLASAIAVGLAQGMAPLPAIRRARSYLIEALRRAPGLGRGHGPLDHGHALTDAAARS
jgi:hydroxymethylpyrimidine/phosphomethylpyrimidine kinase